MDADWFKRNVAAAVLLADERYTPDLHFELPLVQYFDALGRTPVFFATLGKLGRKLDKVIADVALYSRSNDETVEPNKQVWNSLREALAVVNSLTLDLKSPIDFPKLKKALHSAREQVQNALHQLWNKRQESANQGDPVFSDYGLREAHSCIEEVLNFCSSRDADLANHPAMLLVGEAGLSQCGGLSFITWRTKSICPRKP